MKTASCIEPVNAFQRPSAQASGWMGSHYTYDVPAPRAVVDAIASAAQSWYYDAPLPTRRNSGCRRYDVRVRFGGDGGIRGRKR